MTERFTDPARRALQLAQEQAGRLNNPRVECGDILLGLILEEHGVAARALASLGVSYTAVREKLHERPAASPGNVLSASPPFGESATNVIELARHETRKFGHRSVGTEHLLLGIVHDVGGSASQALASLGVDLSRVEGQVVYLMSGYRVTEPNQRYGPHSARNSRLTAHIDSAVSPGLWTAENGVEVSRDLWLRIFPRVYAKHAGSGEEQFLAALREELAGHHPFPSQGFLVAWARYLAKKSEDGWVDL